MRNLTILFYLLTLEAGAGFVSRSSRSHVLKSIYSSSSSSDQEESVLVKFPEAEEEEIQTNGEKDTGDSIEPKSVFMDEVTLDPIEYSSGYSLNGYSSSGVYHNDLPGRFRRKLRAPDENEDGYRDMFGEKKQSFLQKMASLPLRAARRLYYGPKKVETGTLIFIRHGESEWNQNKTFTGWSDPDLSADGVREVEHAARLLLEGGWEIDLVFTSRLKRAIRSAWIILQEMNQVYLPVFKSWRLNERMYGALTGLSKIETAEKLGSELVQEWRGSLRTRPPPVELNSPYWPGRDRKYADLTPEELPRTESLMDCMDRTEPLWEEKIKYELKNGRNVLVVAHANTIRGLVKIIDNIGDEEIQDVAIPTGIPIVYKFGKDMKPIAPDTEERTAMQEHMTGLFLEKPGLLREALLRETEWAEQVPGYSSTLSRVKTPMSSLERSLYKLQAERELGEWAGQFIDPAKMLEDDGNDGNMQKLMDGIWAKGIDELKSGEQFDPDAPEFHETASKEIADEEDEDFSEDSIPLSNIISNQPCIKSIPSASLVPGMGSVPIRNDGVIVMIRHGKTEHNKLKLFTGWEDAPLAPEGIEEAKEAGRLLKAHGFEFDVVYTSWLSRAIDTAWLVLDEMDCLWLPIIKSWRLNERMYGELTGLSKQMVKQRHGAEQFKAWRRGYKTRPPAVSSFSKHYPGNDQRYVKYLNDAKFSVRESIIRSIEKGKMSFHRRFPKTESLKDCMDRTIPFFTERITPEAIEPGKRVLISSSENAIRGLLMHLCEIPESQISDLEIPNGLPLVFDLKSKCLKLLDDGTGRDPLKVHNFGKASSYLFRPCTGEDGSPDEECDITYPSPINLSEEEQDTIKLIKGAKS